MKSQPATPTLTLPAILNGTAVALMGIECLSCHVNGLSRCREEKPEQLRATSAKTSAKVPPEKAELTPEERAADSGVPENDQCRYLPESFEPGEPSIVLNWLDSQPNQYCSNNNAEDVLQKVPFVTESVGAVVSVADVEIVSAQIRRDSKGYYKGWTIVVDADADDPGWAKVPPDFKATPGEVEDIVAADVQAIHDKTNASPMRELTVEFSARFHATIHVAVNATTEEIQDVISNIDVPENDQCKYLPESFEPDEPIQKVLFTETSAGAVVSVADVEIVSAQIKRNGKGYYLGWTIIDTGPAFVANKDQQEVTGATLSKTLDLVVESEKTVLGS